MGDPIIIWLPGTVYDASQACQSYAAQQNWEAADRYYGCDMQPDGDGGVYITCCFAGG